MGPSARRAGLRLAGLLLALPACGDDAAPALPETATACPIDQPLRLVAAPEGFAPRSDTWYGLDVFGDHILYTFDRHDDPARAYWHLDRCTGELEPYPSLAPGLHNPFTIDTPEGRVLYANDALGRKFLVDRLDVPGADDPTPVPGLPEETGVVFPGPYARPYAYFTRRNTPSPATGVYGAAGLGGSTYAAYTHDGDRDVPALRLADDLVATHDLGGDLLLLHDSGELRRVDPRTGAGEALRVGVRHVDRVMDKLVWQAIGDDIAEPVYLHDLESGDDRLIATNDFAARCWFRDIDRSFLGSWSATQNGAVVVLPGPDLFLVAAVRTDTGEPLEIPPHVRPAGSFGGELGLVLAEEPEHVLALWDPLTGEVREWYRGPGPDPWLHAVDGDLADYYLPDPGDSDVGSLWRVDLRTGHRSKMLPRTNRSPIRLADARYLVSFVVDQLLGPPFNSSSYTGEYVRDLKLVDSASGLYTPIADRVADYAIVPGEGLLYLDALGPEPGIWAHPLPFP